MIDLSQWHAQRLRPTGLRRAFLERGFLAAIEWLIRDGGLPDRYSQIELLEQLSRQIKNAKRIRRRSTIKKLDALAADRSATEHERAVASQMAAKLRARKKPEAA